MAHDTVSDPTSTCINVLRHWHIDEPKCWLEDHLKVFQVFLSLVCNHVTLLTIELYFFYRINLCQRIAQVVVCHTMAVKSIRLGERLHDHMISRSSAHEHRPLISKQVTRMLTDEKRDLVKVGLNRIKLVWTRLHYFLCDWLPTMTGVWINFPIKLVVLPVSFSLSLYFAWGTSNV